jgi:TatD DNase family protein
MYSPREDQERWFIKQLEAVVKLELPTIFHERDSQGRFLEILTARTDKTRKGVVHCFSGNIAELEKYLDLGLCIGITGIITMKHRGETLRKMVSEIPVDRLVIETDAPYLTPVPEKKHSRRNEPAFVKSVLHKLAEVRQQDPEELAEVIWRNTCSLYEI